MKNIITEHAGFYEENGRKINIWLDEKENRYYICGGDVRGGFHIPDTINGLPVAGVDGDFLEKLGEVTADSDNEFFTVRDGVLFSKDMTLLLHYPINCEREVYTVPDGVIGIEDGAFGSRSLKKAILPRGLKEIAQYGFAGCRELCEIVIPRSLERVMLKAFADDSALRDVYYEGSEEDWRKILFAEFNESLTGARVHFDFSY